MKLISFRNLLLILSMTTLSLISCNKDDEVTLDFEITLPEKWIGTVYANQGVVYQAARIKQFNNDTIGDWITVFKEPLSAAYNLNSYYAAIKDKITDFDNPYFIYEISEKDTTINLTNFKRLISSELEPYITSKRDTVDLNRTVTRYFFYEKNNGYYFTMSCQDTAYYRLKPVFDGIMSSFHYKN
jgi:hypothetical protein